MTSTHAIDRTEHAAFNRYCEKHPPETAKRIVASETIDHPSEAQLVVLGRKYFLIHSADFVSTDVTTIQSLKGIIR